MSTIRPCRLTMMSLAGKIQPLTCGICCFRKKIVGIQLADGRTTELNNQQTSSFIFLQGTSPHRAGPEGHIPSSFLSPSARPYRTPARPRVAARGPQTGTAMHAGRRGRYSTWWPIFVAGPFLGSLSRPHFPVSRWTGCGSSTG